MLKAVHFYNAQKKALLLQLFPWIYLQHRPNPHCWAANSCEMGK